MEPTETQQIILKAAVQSFRRFGFQKTSLNDVAESANVSRQSVYLHFKNKRELFQRSFEYELAVNVSLVSTTLSKREHPVLALVEAFVVWHGQYIVRGKRLKSEGVYVPVVPTSPEFQKRRAEFVTLIASYLEEQQQFQLPTNAQVTSHEVVDLLLSTSRGIAGFVEDENQYRDEINNAIRIIFNIPPYKGT